MAKEKMSDAYSFLRLRAEQLWLEGERGFAIRLMRRLDAEQAKLFRAQVSRTVQAAK